MDFPEYNIVKETGIVAAGQAICIGIMLGVFALLGKFDMAVLLGGAVGGVISIAYFLSLVICVNIATKKALHEDVKGGQVLMQTAHILRMVGLFAVLALCAQSDAFNLIALALPVVFVRPIMGIAAYIRGKGDSKA